MCAAGLLVTEGYGRGTKYKLPSSFTKVATSDANMATSDANMATSDANMATSDANMATSDANMATSDANMATSIKKRMSREELQELILNNCQEWISLEELAIIVYRTPKYLRNLIMPLMIASNKIEMMFPGIPNHPSQKYKRKDKR